MNIKHHTHTQVLVKPS